jgi:hypothetical protein
MPREVRVVRAGELARRALARSGGLAAPLAAFAEAPYLEAAGELLWIGSQLPAMHPRAVVTLAPPPRGVPLRLTGAPLRGWSSSRRTLARNAIGRFRACAARLRAALITIGPPRGFGALLAAHVPGFPLEAAVPRMHALCLGYARDDPQAVFDASLALLGLGTGLTPSGDDVAGAALFARRFIAPRDPRWRALAARLVREIATRSHVVSAALFADLARRRSFEPLHQMAEALAAGDERAALAAARSLAAIGHSSGWDMLAGFYAGAVGALN